MGGFGTLGIMADERTAYNRRIEGLRPCEFPMIKDDVFLDHAGITLYPKSLMDRFVRDMTSNLYGNPHSSSSSSQRSTSCIDDVRHAALQFFGADPADFDLIFVANATAGIKCVADAFRSSPNGFRYLYHQDSHTSLVGVREEANESECISDDDMESWLNNRSTPAEACHDLPTLFAYPAQSNMNGRKLPLDWSIDLRNSRGEHGSRLYTLLDAAGLVATSPLRLQDPVTAPDFVVLSFNKIFGFPDLGGLIVRRQAYSCFEHRKYFGGGTVDMVITMGEQWHNRKGRSLHECLEDGTLPLHNILALGHAMKVHRELFGSMQQVSDHTSFLRQRLATRLEGMRRGNNGPSVCSMYSNTSTSDGLGNGPTIAFNIRDHDGSWVSTAEFEKLAVLKNFHIRTGGLCNPGGIATALHLNPYEMRHNFSLGFRCDNGNDIINDKPTGVIRVSLGAMSIISDVDRFADFVEEFYATPECSESPQTATLPNTFSDGIYIDQLVVYPIKSCGGFQIPKDTPWDVKPEGLAWDREWCLVHQGTGQALSQKRYPRMTLIKPILDLKRGQLNVSYTDPTGTISSKTISIPLSSDRSLFRVFKSSCPLPSRVCGEDVIAQSYVSDKINNFFTDILGTPCALARFPSGGSGKSMRHAKAHLQSHQRPDKRPPIAHGIEERSEGVITPPDSDTEDNPRILLSNESPILAISLASLQALNNEIVRSGRGSPVSAEVFRANVVIGSRNSSSTTLLPYAEDHWSSISIGEQMFRMLGSCRRCHMVCINQDTGSKNEEPFVTLAKTRKFDGKVFFGTHMCHMSSTSPSIPGSESSKGTPTIQIGDKVAIE